MKKKILPFIIGASFVFINPLFADDGENPSSGALSILLKKSNTSIIYSPNSEAEFNRLGGTRNTATDLILDLGEIDFGNKQYNKIWADLAYNDNAGTDATVDVYIDDAIKASNIVLDIPLNIPNGSYESTRTPNSGLFFKNKYSDDVIVFDIRKDDNVSKMISGVIQGILNQEYGRVYLYSDNHHVTQLNDTKRPYTLMSAYNNTKYGGFGAIVTKYKDSFDKLVVWDETNEWTWPLAQMISAQQKGIPVTVEIRDFIVNELGWNKEIEDIRYKWTDKLLAYQWAIDNLSPNCHKNLCFSAGLREDYLHNPWKIHDYAAASKGFVFWLDQSVVDEEQMIGKICKAMDFQPGAAAMGYGKGKDGDGLNSAINKYNVGFMVSDYYANGSFWCSYPSKAFEQRKGVALDAVPGKVYVCVIWSDGDNIQFDSNLLYEMFKYAKGRGDVPVGVTMASALQELNPHLLEYFYKNRTPNDELVAGPSGFQFIYGDSYNENKYEKWLEMNRGWLETAGFHTACLWNTANQTKFERYMSTCGLQGVFDGWQRLTPKVVDGVVAIDQGAHCWEDGHIYNALKTQPALADKPRFVSLYPTTAVYGGMKGYERLINEMKQIEAEFPGSYVFVLPMDLAATTAKYIEQNGGKY